MIRFIPTKNNDNFDMNSEDWDIIWEYIQYLNKKLIVPVLQEENFIEAGLYQDYSFSSKKTNEIYELLEGSIQDGTLSEYKKKYDNDLDVDNYVLFPSHKLIDFVDFCENSGGFQVKIHIL